jgi:hypothetical protein
MDHLPDATLNRDWPRDLLMFGNREAFKHEIHIFIIGTISILIEL